MSTLRGNPSAGSILLKAMDSGNLQTIVVRDVDLGHFMVDHGSHVFLVSARRSDPGWKATLGLSLLEKMTKVKIQAKAHYQQDLFVGPYLWLACGGQCCELWPKEWAQVIDVLDCITAQHIRIERPPNCSFRVQGSAGELPHTVPLKRFPSLGVAV